jgi:cyclophilin family peptidyl-prolyl cis-trans isomerase
VHNQDVKNNFKVALVTTNYGNFKLKLSNKTPLHRDNFIKLSNESYFDSLLFHRVIKNFMIQGGDPDSKNAEPNIMLGNGGPDYTIPAEFDTSLINKKGVLCAAREGDNINPDKRSSGSQFYIVTGKTFTDGELKMMEKRIDQQNKNSFLISYINKPENILIKNKMESLKKARNQKELNAYISELNNKIKPEYDLLPKFRFSKKNREIYKTVGGAPHLDGSYTVFGEVIEGMNVIDSISKVQIGKSDRPIKDVIFSIKIIE